LAALSGREGSKAVVASQARRSRRPGKRFSRRQSALCAECAWHARHDHAERQHVCVHRPLHRGRPYQSQSRARPTAKRRFRRH